MGLVLEPHLNNDFRLVILHSPRNTDSFTDQFINLDSRKANTSAISFRIFAGIWSIPAISLISKQDGIF